MLNFLIKVFGFSMIKFLWDVCRQKKNSKKVEFYNLLLEHENNILKNFVNVDSTLSEQQFMQCSVKCSRERLCKFIIENVKD